MDEPLEPSTVLGPWKEWAQHLKSEANRFNAELRDLRDKLSAQIGDVYARIDNRHDAVHTLLIELEARLRNEITLVSNRITFSVSREEIARRARTLDDKAEVQQQDKHEDAIQELQKEVTSMRAVAQVWGIIAGALGALIIVVVEWWLGKH